MSWHRDPSPLLPKKAVTERVVTEAAEPQGEGTEGGNFEDGGLFKPPGALLREFMR